MIKEAIAKVVERQDLTEAEMIDAMSQIMGGEATPAQVGSFITALRMKGETLPEIVGAAKVMRAHATPIQVGKVVDLDRDEINVDRETILDTCGTGGSGTKSFNILPFDCWIIIVIKIIQTNYLMVFGKKTFYEM